MFLIIFLDTDDFTKMKTSINFKEAKSDSEAHNFRKKNFSLHKKGTYRKKRILVRI